MRSVFIVLFMFLVNALVSEKVRRVYQKIFNFDLGLSQNLTNPKNREGEQMIRDIETFTDLLWEIRDKIKNKNKTVIQQVQPFVDQKTPMFLSHPLDEDKVKSAFNWDDDDLDVLFHVSKHSQVLWDEVKYWFKKTIAGNETYWLN
uniref:Uncharacterized protein n=1 Tax=Graphocephala atropunctata TaxID=36148 RepID=A0A1B6K9C7_9HEMI